MERVYYLLAAFSCGLAVNTDAPTQSFYHKEREAPVVINPTTEEKESSPLLEAIYMTHMAIEKWDDSAPACSSESLVAKSMSMVMAELEKVLEQPNALYVTLPRISVDWRHSCPNGNKPVKAHRQAKNIHEVMVDLSVSAVETGANSTDCATRELSNTFAIYMRSSVTDSEKELTEPDGLLIVPSISVDLSHCNEGQIQETIHIL